MPTRRSLHATGSPLRCRASSPAAGSGLGSWPPWQRAHRADRQAAFAEVQRQRRGNGVAEPVGDRDAEHDARAAAAVEVVGEEMRRERRQDVLDGAVLVDVAGHAERGQIADLLGVGDRAAEDQDRQPPADRSCGWCAPDRRRRHGAAAGRARSGRSREVRPDTGQQLRGALHRQRGWPALSRAVAKRSRTNAVSSATMTVLVVGTMEPGTPSPGSYRPYAGAALASLQNLSGSRYNPNSYAIVGSRQSRSIRAGPPARSMYGHLPGM